MVLTLIFTSTHLFGSVWMTTLGAALVGALYCWISRAKILILEERESEFDDKLQAEVNRSKTAVGIAVAKTLGLPLILEKVSTEFILEIIAHTPTEQEGEFFFIMKKRNHGEHIIAIQGMLRGDVDLGALYSVQSEGGSLRLAPVRPGDFRPHSVVQLKHSEVPLKESAVK